MKIGDMVKTKRPYNLDDSKYPGVWSMPGDFAIVLRIHPLSSSARVYWLKVERVSWVMMNDLNEVQNESR